MSEIETLKKVLQDDFLCLTDVGDIAGGFTVVAVEDSYKGRWHMWVQVVVQSITGTYYGFTFGRGLTERDENQEPDPSDIRVMTRRVEVTEVVHWDRNPL